MDVTVERVAGIDVAKAEVVVALRVPGPNRTRVQEVRTYAAFTSMPATRSTVTSILGLLSYRSTNTPGGAARNEEFDRRARGNNQWRRVGPASVWDRARGTKMKRADPGTPFSSTVAAAGHEGFGSTFSRAK